MKFALKKTGSSFFFFAKYLVIKVEIKGIIEDLKILLKKYN